VCIVICCCSVDNCVPLLIQQIINISHIFNRSWAEYKVGFNDSRGNYRIGNDLLSQLTMTGRYKLKFDLQARYSRLWYYAEYSTFMVLSESSNYRVIASGASGNAGYDAFSYHNGAMFSTFDRDNDAQTSINCAATWGYGYWYKDCTHCRSNCFNNNFHWTGLPGGSALRSARGWLQCK